MAGQDSPDIDVLSVALRADATIGEVEKAFDQAHHQSGGECLEIDMRACQFIEAAALVHIISQLRAWTSLSKRARLRLPVERKVRDFFRVWKFPQALRDATGISFSDLVHADDMQYFGEATSADDVRYTRIFKGVPLPPSRFYGIKSFFARNIASAARLAKEESGTWKDTQVARILNKHMHNLGGRVGSHIIHEAMMNAFRHPAASLIQTATHLEGWDEKGESTMKYLTIVFWDDGESIVGTLRSGLLASMGTGISVIPSVMERYRVSVESETGVKEAPVVIGPDFVPSPEARDEYLLLAATLPGVTRDPKGEGHFVDADLANDEILNRPGMGLFVLTNTAVAVLGGTVSIRTGNLFLNMKRPQRVHRETCKYQVKIKRVGPWVPTFLGNMITVRLPLNPKP